VSQAYISINGGRDSWPKQRMAGKRDARLRCATREGSSHVWPRPEKEIRLRFLIKTVEHNVCRIKRDSMTILRIKHNT